MDGSGQIQVEGLRFAKDAEDFVVGVLVAEVDDLLLALGRKEGELGGVWSFSWRKNRQQWTHCQQLIKSAYLADDQEFETFPKF